MAEGATGARRETPRSVTILGSTGSVGCNTVELIAADPEAYRVEALAALRNVELLARQARALKARLAVVADDTQYQALKTALAGSGIAVAAGAEAVVEAAARPTEWVMAAIVGAAGLASVMAAVRRGALVAFANKEVLVCAGALVTAEAQRCGARLLPVDSEHNAIFQVFAFEQRAAIERIMLTASGGPFLKRSLAEMRAATPEQAVAHPNWRMGAKISVDSATMMNKGLEVIEAHHLFALDSARLDVVVHPQSVIHGLVYYSDGSVLAQLGSPDMRTPIANALGWPERIPAPSPRLDLAKLAQLTFEAPDPARFPALRIARAALEADAGAPCVLNAANEVAVASFLDRRIGFLDIAATVERVLEALPDQRIASLEDVHAIDAEARAVARRIIGNGLREFGLTRAMASSGKPVLVTGATGFVGSAVTRALLAQGRRVCVLVRAGSDRRNIAGLDVEARIGSLEDGASLQAAAAGCGALFHVAADYRLWVRDPAAMYAANVDGTQRLMAAALEAGVERIVYTSSVATLGVTADGTPADETTRSTLADMIGPYKRSKFLAEEAVRGMVGARGLPAVIVNPSTPIGPRDVKPTPTGRMIIEAAAGRMPAFVDTGLNLVHVDDVAAGHLLAERDGRVGERYILGGEDMSLALILAEIARLCGRKAPKVRVPVAAVWPVALVAEAVGRTTGREPFVTRDGLRMARKKMFFSSAKAERALGYRRRPAVEGIAEAIQWFRLQGMCP